MPRSNSSDGRPPWSPGLVRRLGAGAVALGSGYQRNRDNIEPMLRAGVDLLALVVLLAGRVLPRTRGPLTEVPPGHDHHSTAEVS